MSKFLAGMSRVLKGNYDKTVDEHAEIRRERGDIYETKESRKGDIPTSSTAPFASPPSGYSSPRAGALATKYSTLVSKTLTSKLKALYMAQDTLPKLIEDESIPEYMTDDFHVNLQILPKSRSDAYRKQQIDISQIFDKVENQESLTKVLIIGEAGIGKTTLLHSISYQWSKGTIFAGKFDYVFKIDLKKLLSEGIKAALMRVNPEYIWPRLIEMSIEAQQMELMHKHKPSGVEVTITDIQPALQGRMLLLLDGYDEIAHLDKQDDADSVVYKVMRSIDKYPVIITSRPNMVPPDKQGGSTRKIEIIGFNQEKESENYIHKYFAKQQEALLQDIEWFYKADPQVPSNKVIQRMQAHFSEQVWKFTAIKGIITAKPIMLGQGSIKSSIVAHYQSIEDALKTQLSSNFCLKEIATIPINLIMLCLIASDQRSMPQFHGDFNIGILYQEVLIWLGRRSSQSKDLGIDGSIFNLEELLVLREIAYAGFSQGRLVIEGAVIDELSRQHIQSGPIKGVYEFGLLRKENGVVQIHQGDPGKRAGNDDYVFIHPSFQEYLAAHSLKARLSDPQKQVVTGAAKFIAWHRYEPRYLMTLKFLSGIVSNHQHNSNVEQAQALVTRFWEAMTCDVDGILELGIEAKVTLLMHLLNQAKVKGVIDPRIPNLQIIQDLIDRTVLKDIAKWGQQIIDSGYLSKQIVEKLNDYLAGGRSKDREEHKGSPEEEEVDFTIDKVQEVTVAVEIITSLMNKSEFGDREKILKQLLSLLCSHNREIQKLGLENLSKIIDSTIETSSLKDCSSMVISLFLTANNLANYAAKVLAKIIKILPSIAIKALDSLSIILNNEGADDSLKDMAANGLLEILKAMQPVAAHAAIKIILTDAEASSHLKTVAISILIEISKTFPDTASIAVSTINSILMSEEPSHLLKKEVVKALSEIAKSVPEYAHVAVEVMQIILNNNGAIIALKITATESLTEIAQAIPEHAIAAFEVMKEILNKDVPTGLKIAATKSISAIVKVLPAYTTNALSIMRGILDDEKADDSLKDMAAKSFPEILSVMSSVEAWDTIKEILNSKEASDNLKSIAINCIPGILKTMPSCALAAFEAMKSIGTNKKASDDLREVAIGNLGEVVKVMPDCSLAAFEAMKKIWDSKKASDRLKAAAALSLTEIAENVPTCSLAAFDVMKAILDSKKTSEYLKTAAAKSLPEIVKSMPDGEVFTKISSILNSKETNNYLKVAAAKSLPEIAKTMNVIMAFGVMKSILDKKNLREEYRKAALHSLVEIVKKAPNYSSKAVDAMKNILNNEEATTTLKIATTKGICEIIKVTSFCSQAIFDAMRGILESEKASEELKKAIISSFSEIVCFLPSSAPVVFDLMKTILNDKKVTIALKMAAAKSLGEITHASSDCAREAFDLMKAILSNGEENPSLKITAISVIAEIACVLPPFAPSVFDLMKAILDSEIEEATYLKGEAIKNICRIAKVMPYAEAFDAMRSILNSKKATDSLKKESKKSIKEITKFMSFDEVADLLNDEIDVIRNLAKLEILDRLKDDEEVEKLNCNQVVTILRMIDRTKSNEEERELNLSAKKALEYILATIDETGIDWLNQNFGELTGFSETRSFLTAIFHNILGDGAVSEIEAEFITKCIMEIGFPLTIIPGEGRIIFENVVYCLQDNQEILAQIVQAISPLALQYKTHGPLFLNTGSALPIAAVDIQDTDLGGDVEHIPGYNADLQLSGVSLE